MTGTLKDVHISDWLKVGGIVFTCGIFFATVTFGTYSKVDGMALKSTADLHALRIETLENASTKISESLTRLADNQSEANKNYAVMASAFNMLAKSLNTNYEITPPQ